jgi:ornithine cyclodeaminase/alanine dehydrogenase-like protein (mu-crystallin family)
VAHDALQQAGALPRVAARARLDDRWGDVAHELLEGGDDGGGLVGAGARGDDLELGAAVRHDPSPYRAMPDLHVLNHDAVLAAVNAADAIEHVRDAFLRHQRGEWVMPAKVYLDSPPYGDFRAMPARGGDLAMLKWIASFPGNPQRANLPAVMGMVCISDARTALPLALLDAAAVTALRTGAVAAVAARALAKAEARTVGIIGCGLHGAWTARCLAAAGYGPGVCFDPREDAARQLADELGWRTGTLADALNTDVVNCVTPGHTIVVDAKDLRPGMHLNMLGADGPGKAEASVGAVRSCALFCDEWAQASHGGELTGAVEAGLVTRHDVTDLGAVLAGDAPGRPGPASVTLFDSTGLAIQDLAVARAALEALDAGRIAGQTISL